MASETRSRKGGCPAKTGSGLFGRRQNPSNGAASFLNHELHGFHRSRADLIAQIAFDRHAARSVTRDASFHGDIGLFAEHIALLDRAMAYPAFFARVTVVTEFDIVG